MSAKNTPIKTVVSYFRSKPLRIVFASVWAFFVGLIITSGFGPHPYALEMLDAPEPHAYAMGLVVTLVVAMLFHLSFLVTIDVYMRSQWKFFTMLIVTTFFLLFFGMMVIHAPAPLGWMIAWSFLSFLLFLVICFCQACLFFLRCVFRQP
ncbi:MAG: hypothetical protein ACTH7W_00795 [Psychrobacter sp.]|uniref:hypothetical protein n=1 Tax=unclassified Psychrobacter TaxID=196806 RepID=UPI0017882886|nr:MULTISPECIES: hypothetical protein [unclassified Psychrobacter]MBE0440723.1 hypothetical protein [Psychrobacter sp. FME13]